MQNRDTPVGISEIAHLAGAHRTAVDKWIERHKTFPGPAWAIGGRRTWRLGDILDWLRNTGRWPTRHMAAALRDPVLEGRPAQEWEQRYTPIVVAALVDAGLLAGDRELRLTDTGREFSRAAAQAPAPYVAEKGWRDQETLSEKEWHEIQIDLRHRIETPAPSAGE